MKTKLINKKNVDTALVCLSSMAIYSRVYEMCGSGIVAVLCGTLAGFIAVYAIRTVAELENKNGNADRKKIHRGNRSIYNRQGYWYSLELAEPRHTTATAKQKPLRILTGTPSFDAGGTSGITVHDILGI